MSTNLLEMSEVSVRYRIDDREISALDNVSLTIPPGGYTLGVVGESGSGKTTLGMSIMNSIERPGVLRAKSILFEGKDVLKLRKSELRKYRWQDVSMVYQSAMNSLNPVKNITDPIAEVMIEHNGESKNEAHDKAVKLLSQVGIKPERTGDYPHEMSGGMRQRVVIALALALSPKLLIADEPTSALDVVVQKQILALLKKEITRRKLSLVFITHEIGLLHGLVDNVAVMYAGEIVETGDIRNILLHPKHPYTEMLLATMLKMDSKLEVMTTKVGGRADSASLASIVDLYSGNYCKYVSQCKYAFDRCKKERPKLIEVENGRRVACHKYN